MLIGIVWYSIIRIYRDLPWLPDSVGIPERLSNDGNAFSADASHATISLVTSYWARPKDQNAVFIAPHQREIEGAMLANLLNPYLNQVVVILDSITAATIDCRDFLEDMTIKLNGTNAPAKLSCIERREDPNGEGRNAGQTSYVQMFHYATFHPSVASDIVILSNADQVFDGTLKFAKRLPMDTIFVLSTQGYESHRVPPNVRQQYRNLVGASDDRQVGDNRCLDTLFGDDDEYQELRDVEYSDSWDTYMFHRSLLNNTLPMDMNHRDNFTRLDFWREPSSYYMNELAAEYAALYDITRGLMGTVTVWNACQLIRTWHFHLTAKMHRAQDQPKWPANSKAHGERFLFFFDFGPTVPNAYMNGTEANSPFPFVTPPYAFAPMCYDEQSCFSDNNRDGSFFISNSHIDATEYVNNPPEDEDDDGSFSSEPKVNTTEYIEILRRRKKAKSKSNMDPSFRIQCEPQINATKHNEDATADAVDKKQL